MFARADSRRPQTSPPSTAPHFAVQRFIQSRLMAGPVDDPCEREAERTASRAFQGVRASRERSPAPESGPGRPLPATVLAPVERLLGTDLGGVRVFTGGQADRINDAMGSRALTFGRSIFFANGEYDPGSTAGRELIAHELTHVVQQSGPRTGPRAVPVTPTLPRVQCARKRLKQFRFREDADGRPVEAKGPIKNKSYGRMGVASLISKPFNDFLRQAGLKTTTTRFEGGHLIGDRFRGPDKEKNIVPVPHNFNTVAYKKEENALSSLIPPGGNLNMQVKVKYPSLNPLTSLFKKSADEATLEAAVGTPAMDNLRDLFRKEPLRIEWDVWDNALGDVLDSTFKPRIGFKFKTIDAALEAAVLNL